MKNTKEIVLLICPLCSGEGNVSAKIMRGGTDKSGTALHEVTLTHLDMRKPCEMCKGIGRLATEKEESLLN